MTAPASDASRAAADVATLLEGYGLPAPIVSALSGGMENVHYRAETPRGPVVVTVLCKKTRQEAEHYVRFLEGLRTAGAPVPRLRPLVEGGWVSEHAGHPVIVADFIDGRQYAVVPPRLVEAAGAALGRVHRLAAHVDCPLPPNLRLGADEAALLAELPDDDFARWARTTLRETDYVTRQTGPMVAVHADLFPDNIIVPAGQGRDVVFIDWEDGSRDFPTMDVGMALLGLCCPDGFCLPRARRLLRGYATGSGHHLDPSLVRDCARYAAVLVSLRRYRWQHAGHLPADTARTHTALMRPVTELQQMGEEMDQP
ncbi:phosphotransferase (plasmid) [Streptomyces sp. NBC_00637]|uniref:phosphotransferase n=1 Tax=Streptomyces sp. NBC_00637 TaxID=2903667 RepID=UPI002F90CB99